MQEAGWWVDDVQEVDDGEARGQDVGIQEVLGLKAPGHRTAFEDSLDRRVEAGELLLVQGHLRNLLVEQAFGSRKHPLMICYSNPGQNQAPGRHRRYRHLEGDSRYRPAHRNAWTFHGPGPRTLRWSMLFSTKLVWYFDRFLPIWLESIFQCLV